MTRHQRGAQGPDPVQALLQAGPPDAVQPPTAAGVPRWCLVAADAEKAVLRTIATQTASFALLNIFHLLVERRGFTLPWQGSYDPTSRLGRQSCRLSAVSHLKRAMAAGHFLPSADVREHSMRKVIRGYARDKDSNLILIGTIPVPQSKDKRNPAARQNRRHLIRQGATIFKKETIVSAEQTK